MSGKQVECISCGAPPNQDCQPGCVCETTQAELDAYVNTAADDNE